MLAHRRRWLSAPFASSFRQRSLAVFQKPRIASRAPAIAALPRRSRSDLPVSECACQSVSTRLTKKDATEASPSIGCPLIDPGFERAQVRVATAS